MELWTTEHMMTLIPATILMIAAGVSMHFLLRKKPVKIRMIPFQIFACILFILEIGKQAVSISRGYDLYHLPFHFCSLFIFALPFTAFYNGKHIRSVRAVTAALCTSVFLLMMIYPNLIYSAYDITHYFNDYMAFHTVTFHNIVMLEFILMLSLRLYDFTKASDRKPILLFSVGFCLFSSVMAQILKTNYANFYSCNIPVFESIRITLQSSLGYTLTQLLYVLIVSVLTICFVFMSYGLYRLIGSLTIPKRAAQR